MAYRGQETKNGNERVLDLTGAMGFSDEGKGKSDLDDTQVLQIVYCEAQRQAEIRRINADDLCSDVMLKLYDKDTRKLEDRLQLDGDRKPEKRLIDSISQMSASTSYIRRIVQTHAITLLRKRLREPSNLDWDVQSSPPPELPASIPANLGVARAAVRKWFATGPVQVKIWGKSETKRYVLVDARRKFANRIANVELDSHLRSGDSRLRHIAFIEWFIHFPKQDCQLVPAGAVSTILQIWEGVAVLILAAMNQEKNLSRKIGHPEVCQVIRELGGSISAIAWRKNCSRGWKRIHELDPELTERFFGLRQGESIGSKYDN
ncbi:MAG: hypothetical protein KDB03_01535 [Planctomycetales bacterium]|nr:hypothetical protein [Planctomycetales bacterium]